ncbi:hypothetical protein ACFZAV_05910 [Streptomyces sp. NPDC008343]
MKPAATTQAGRRDPGPPALEGRLLWMLDDWAPARSVIAGGRAS